MWSRVRVAECFNSHTRIRRSVGGGRVEGPGIKWNILKMGRIRLSEFLYCWAEEKEEKNARKTTWIPFDELHKYVDKIMDTETENLQENYIKSFSMY